MRSYDVIVIGAGPGGYRTAMCCASKGLSTALIEKDTPGGTCLNRGCIPTKALLHASSLYREMKEADSVGVHGKEVTFDEEQAVRYRDETVETLVKGLCMSIKKTGCEMLEGTGYILNETDGPYRKVRLATPQEEEILLGKNIVLATGSTVSRIPIEGKDLACVITSDDLLEKEDLPEDLIIIGGGVVGCEFAEFFADLGRKVTILESMPRILHTMDSEVSRSLAMHFKKKGAAVHTGVQVLSVKEEDGMACVTVLEKEKEVVYRAQKVLMAAGRKTCLDAFDPDLDIKIERGRICVNGHNETDVPGIFAIGDIAPGMQLAHKAEAEGTNVAECIAGKESMVDVRLIPSGVYTSPEIAAIGYSEEEAKALGYETVSAKAITGANSRSVIGKEERGFVKITAEKSTGKILGAVMMCARATDMISEMTTALVHQLTVRDMLAVVRPHPTYEEILRDALEAFPDDIKEAQYGKDRH